MNEHDQTDVPAVRDDVFVIESLEVLKVVSDALRLRIIEALRGAPRTVKALAPELGVTPINLYYHINLLERHGLIRAVGTRLVSGIVEKHYQATAYHLSVARTLLAPESTPDDEGLDMLLGTILDETKREIKRSVRAGLVDPSQREPGAGGLLLGRRWLRLTPAQAQVLAERLSVCGSETEESDVAASDTDMQTYEVLVALYPTIRETNAAEG